MTAQSQYAYTTFTLGSSTATTSSSSDTAATPPPVNASSGGTVSRASTALIVPPQAVPFASTVSQVSISTTFPPATIVPSRSGVGDIQQIWLTDVFNGARILPSLQTKPSIIALKYTDLQLVGRAGRKIPESRLRLAYSADGKRWTILSRSVVDPVNNTVAVIGKVGGYYMIVAR